jgi:hypothetical protein
VQIKQNILYHFLLNIELCQSHRNDGKDVKNLKYLGLLIDYINNMYKLTTKHLLLLLKRGEIIYNLLWALFKPNLDVYSIYTDTQAGRCLKYTYNKEKVELNSSIYFRIEGCYLDFNGKRIGEATKWIKINKFWGID